MATFISVPAGTTLLTRPIRWASTGLNIVPVNINAKHTPKSKCISFASDLWSDHFKKCIWLQWNTNLQQESRGLCCWWAYLSSFELPYTIRYWTTWGFHRFFENWMKKAGFQKGSVKMITYRNNPLFPMYTRYVNWSNPYQVGAVTPNKASFSPIRCCPRLWIWREKRDTKCLDNNQKNSKLTVCHNHVIAAEAQNTSSCRTLSWNQVYGRHWVLGYLNVFLRHSFCRLPHIVRSFLSVVLT